MYVKKMFARVPCIKAETHHGRDLTTRRDFSVFEINMKQPMKGNFKRYVDQITQNVITLLNI
jgi:hypothetical protein